MDKNLHCIISVNSSSTTDKNTMKYSTLQEDCQNCQITAILKKKNPNKYVLIT